MGDDQGGKPVREEGWGWLVAMGMALMFIVMTGPKGPFSFLFGEFLEDLNVGTKGLTVISSVNFLCYSFTGLMSEYSLKSFSCRQVCIFGSCLFIAGNFLTIFATRYEQMLLTYGVIPGVGMGLMVPAMFQSFNTYFVTRRTVVMSISQTIIGAGLIVYPLLVEELMANFGFRGAQAIITALGINTILAAVVLKPSEKESKARTIPLVPLNPDFTVVTLSSQDNHSENIRHSKEVPVNDSNNLQHDVKVRSFQSVEDANESAHEDDDEVTPLKEKPELTKATLPEEANIPITLLIGRFDGLKTATEVSDIAIPDAGDRHPEVVKEPLFRKLFRTVVDFFDLTLLSDLVYVNLSIGASCVFFADLTFFMLHPLMLFNLDFSKGSTALCMAMGAGGDLVGRLFLIGLGLMWPSLSSREIFWGGSLMAVVLRTATSSFVAVSIVTTSLGFFRGWVMVTGPLVFADHCADRFPSAFGLYMVINGLIAIIVGPLIGWIRDETGSYAISTHALSILTAVCVVLWAVEWVILRKKKKSKS